MFKFLFRNKPVEAVKETQRETVSRAMGEVNGILGGMAVRPKVAVNLETGLIEIELPEQMPDEALALPAPETPEASEAADASETADPSDTHSEATEPSKDETEAPKTTG